MSFSDNLKSYLRHFAKEQAFCFRPAALEDAAPAVGKIIPLHPRRCAADASLPGRMRWRGWYKVRSRQTAHLRSRTKKLPRRRG